MHRRTTSTGLATHRRPVAVTGPRSRPVDVPDDAVDVSTGQDQQGHGVHRLRVRRAWTTQVATENRPRGSGKQVGPSTGQRFELRDRCPHRRVLVCKAGSRSVESDLEPDVGVHTTAM